MALAVGGLSGLGNRLELGGYTSSSFGCRYAVQRCALCGFGPFRAFKLALHTPSVHGTSSRSLSEQDLDWIRSQESHCQP